MDPNLVDPEVRARRTLPDIPVRTWWGRAIVRVGVHAFRTPMPPSVTRRRLRRGGMRARVFTLVRRRSDAALLWIHGGGMVGGAALMDDRLCAEVVDQLGITVVSAEYRRAPRHPFPAAHEDVTAVWDWMQRDASALGIDPERVAIGGGSAGGGLAASLVLRLMDAGRIGPAPRRRGSVWGHWICSSMRIVRWPSDFGTRGSLCDGRSWTRSPTASRRGLPMPLSHVHCARRPVSGSVTS